MASTRRSLPCISFIVLVFGALEVSLSHAQQVPPPWQAQEIGTPALRGASSHASGVFTIDAAGEDIWGRADEFHFVYQPVRGDVEIVARVESIVAAHAWSKAGVMIRASLDAGSPHAFALVSPARGVHTQRRTTAGGTSSSTFAGFDAAPVWLRAVRTGTRVTTSWSADGISWIEIATDTIPLGSDAFVGLAVTSHHAGRYTRARVSAVRIGRAGLPPPQQSFDLGSPSIAGRATFASGAYTISAGGRDIWDRADQFHFVFQPVTGDADVVGRVASIANTHRWAKAGVMIRESLTAESRHATMLVSVSRGYAFQRRSDPGEYSVHTSGGSGTAPGWVRLVRTGDLFEAYRSTNGSTWTRVGSDTIPMGQTVYVGLAVTSHNDGAATTAVVDNFRVSAVEEPNGSPAVSITAPAHGAEFTVPATVTISASASDPENRMASVDFYLGSTLIARDTTAPYAVSWSASSAGTYRLTATAHDRDGGSTTSAGVTVAVRAATTTTPPRFVAFVASSDHAVSVTSYLFEVFPAGSDPATARPVATSDLGKPPPNSSGDIVVDRSTLFENLPGGSYLATVSAVGPGGRTRGAAVPFTR